MNVPSSSATSFLAIEHPPQSSSVDPLPPDGSSARASHSAGSDEASALPVVVERWPAGSDAPSVRPWRSPAAAFRSPAPCAPARALLAPAAFFAVPVPCGPPAFFAAPVPSRAAGLLRRAGCLAGCPAFFGAGGLAAPAGRLDGPAARRSAISSSRAFESQLVRVVASPQRGVRRPVGDIRPETARAQHDRPPRLRVGAELAERSARTCRSGAAWAAANSASASSIVTVNSWSSVSRLRVSDAPLQERPEPAVGCDDLLARLGIGADRPRELQEPQRLLEA